MLLIRLTTTFGPRSVFSMMNGNYDEISKRKSKIKKKSPKIQVIVQDSFSGKKKKRDEVY